MRTLHVVSEHIIANLADILFDVVKSAGEKGFPAGHLYAMLMDMLCVSDFNRVMDIVQGTGHVVLQAHCYYYKN